MKYEIPIRDKSVVSVKGQTVIPKEIREAAGIKEGTKLTWILTGSDLRVIVIPDDPVRAVRGILKDTGYTFDDFLRERNEERERERLTEQEEEKRWRATSSTPRP
jgi:AbrB family looped-hinge helix DNA binding protein